MDEEMALDGIGFSEDYCESKAPLGIVFLMQSKSFDFATARAVVIKGGVDLPPIPNSKLGNKIERIAEMLCDGMSAYAISKELGVDKAGVARFCHKQGLELPARYKVENLAQEVRQMAADGKSAAVIGEALGFSGEAIRGWCAKNSVELRDSFHKHIVFAKGGKYIKVPAPSHPFADSKGYVSLHRLIAEITVGRYLKREEIVHHVDGNTHNNAPSNLEITTISKHASEHNARGETGWSRYHEKLSKT